MTDIWPFSYTLTFLLLASEMATFCVLVFPLPHMVRKKLFHFLSESPIIAKLAYGVKISFMYVGLPRLVSRPLLTYIPHQFRRDPVCGRTAEDVEGQRRVRSRKVNRVGCAGRTRRDQSRCS